MKTFRLLGILLISAIIIAPDAEAQRRRKKNQEPQGMSYDTALYNAMEFRLIGPFRGGRATAVAGVVQDPMTYFMGATGGVWKTTNASGESWEVVSDGFFNTASVGAIAVSESDPNVVYVQDG